MPTTAPARATPATGKIHQLRRTKDFFGGGDVVVTTRLAPGLAGAGVGAAAGGRAGGGAGVGAVRGGGGGAGGGAAAAARFAILASTSAIHFVACSRSGSSAGASLRKR